MVLRGYGDMIKKKKTEEELQQEAEAKRRLAEDDEDKGGGGSRLVPDQITPDAPNPARDFANIMRTYGLSGETVDAVTRFITDTGSENVYHSIPELLEKLMKFPRQIPPYTRRQVLDHWIALNKIEPPENYNTLVEASSKDVQRMSTKEKYTVDENGDIAVAVNETNPLSYEEAKKLSVEKKAALRDSGKNAGPKYVFDPGANAIRMAKDGEQGGTLDEAKELKRMAETDNKKEPESPFAMGEDGKWQLVPGAKLSTLEMMTWQSIQRANAAGVPIDPMEEMLNYAERMKNLQGLFGGGNTLPVYLASPEAFTAAVKAAVGGDNEAVKSLNAKIDQMIADQHAAELRRRDEENTALQNQIVSANNKIKDLEEKVNNKTPVTGRTGFDIIDKIADRIPKTAEVKDIIVTVAQNPPKLPGISGADRSKTLANVAEKLESGVVLKDAEDEFFNFK